jgi:dihydroorotate dehydrogenase (NAD+) catalytic subunit
MVIDLDTMQPALGGITGGLSGPAIRPVAVRCVWQVHKAVPHLPLLGMGGIMTGRDALQFILAGASAVSVGTAVFNDPTAPIRILQELQDELEQRGLSSVTEAIGLAHRDRTAVREVLA